jgi:hypothetical protein
MARQVRAQVRGFTAREIGRICERRTVEGKQHSSIDPMLAEEKHWRRGQKNNQELAL